MAEKEHLERLSILGQGQGQGQGEELPRTICCSELPKAEIERVDAVMDRLGITDPLLRKYNALAWIRGYYQALGENQGKVYEAIVGEQLRLGRILETIGDLESQVACEDAGHRLEIAETSISGTKTIELDRAA